MSEVVHLHEMDAEVTPITEAPVPAAEPASAEVAEVPISTEDGITILGAPQRLSADEDGCVASIADPVTKMPPQRAIRPVVSVSHMRISSRPPAGDTHFSNAAKNAAAASAVSGKSHVVPYEGTAVCLSLRGRFLHPGARAGASGVVGGTKTVVPPTAEEAGPAKALSPQETAAVGRTATRARIRAPEPCLTPAGLQKAPKAYAADAAANGSEAGPAKKAARRRLVDTKAAAAVGKRPKHPEGEAHVAIKASKSRRTLKVSKKAQSSSDNPEGAEPASSLPKTLKKKMATSRAAAAETGGEAAVPKKGPPRKITLKKSSKTTAAAEAALSADAPTTNGVSGESANHAAAAKVDAQTYPNAVVETSDTEEEKSIVKQAHVKAEGEIRAPAAEGDACAMAEHADPEAMDAAEDFAEHPKGDAIDMQV